MDKPKRDKNSFGLVYFQLHNQLYRAGRYAQAQFNLYISCRCNIREWEYNESDIRVMTGISRNTVKAHCNAFVQAGIFIPDSATSNGSPRYRLEKSKFKAYLCGNAPLDPVKERIKLSDSELKGGNNEPERTLNDVLAEPLKGASDQILSNSKPESPPPPVNGELGGTVNGNIGGCQWQHRGGGLPLTPNNKDYKKEEKKDTHTRGGECVHDLNSSDANAVKLGFSKTKAVLEEARLYFTGKGNAVTVANLCQPANSVQRSASTVNTSIAPPAASTQRSAFVAPAIVTSAVVNPELKETIPDDQISGEWRSDVALSKLSKRQLDIWKDLRLKREADKKRQELEQQEQDRQLASMREKEYQEQCAYTPRFDELGEKRWENGGLTPSERAEYFCEYLKTINGNGYFDKQTNRRRTFRLTTTEESLKTAYNFFELNPTLEPDLLIRTLKKCCIVNVTESKPEQGDFCEHFYQWKAGANLTFFWKHFSNVCDDLPAVPPNAQPELCN